ncbi:3-deoxy-D-arabinoheptulosonate-7-phosphate synthase [Sporobacter termitidis DSM 10068]|uniref:3-deoxy-D-arabinoheptulosonate-7-phosphate synthase n=1 Tax=Sporobacter termitidis DSM 10068 TaxID=1123282 RepID=A0A1M5ZC60_9FIRM|nr:3-deoxy-7-phosphoheptulonate synthase [Sporobacter termitidis]SHI21493.1 3-deoxy-D-arabinoheptulosonate-7-phosphate synthase [Sporobacter termitidis DSM 10068]
MVFVLKKNAAEDKIAAFVKKIEGAGFTTFLSTGTEHTVVCLIGNTARLDVDFIVQTNEIVEYGKRVTEPYKAVNRTVHPADTLVTVGGVTIGEGYFQVIAGPCSVESEAQIIGVARSVKESGATLLRGGAFKPRTSPYSFQGLQERGLEYLLAAKRATGLPIVTEVMNQTQLPLFGDVDVLQIGARNMQNYDLLKEVGRCRKPVVLKRGFSSTIEEFLMSAEYIVAEGNPNVILCERGIRTFETMTRNTLDLSAVPLLKQKSHLPVIVDPSHAAGIRSLVPALSKAAVAVGADGLMIEAHNDPANALSDGAQSLDLDQFRDLCGEIRRRAEFEGKKVK